MSNIEHILNPKIKDFNVYFGGASQNLIEKEKYIDALEIIKQQVQSQIVEIKPVPLTSPYSYHSLDLMKTLKKSTILKIAMKQTKWD